MLNKIENIFIKFFSYFLITPFIFLLEYLLFKLMNQELTLVIQLTFSITAISGFVYIIILFISSNIKINTQFKILFILLYSAIIYLIFYLFKVSGNSFFCITFVILEFLFLSIINSLIVFHDDFINLCGQKENYELKTFLYQNKFVAMDLDHKIKNIQKFYIIIAIIFFVLIFLANFFKSKLEINTIFVNINSILFFISLAYLYYITNYYKKESIYLNLGFTKIIPNRKKFYKTLFSIIICSLLLSILCSRNFAVIKFSLPENKTKQTTHVPIPSVSIEIPTQGQGMFGIPNVPDTDEKPSIILSIIGYIIQGLGYLLLGVLILFILYKLFSPLFSKEFRLFIKDIKMFSVFNKINQSIKQLFTFLFKNNSKIEKYNKIYSKEFTESITKIIKKSNKSKEKLFELDKLTRYFIKIINFGSKNKIIYTKNLAPKEYTNMLVEYFEKQITNEFKNEYISCCNSVGSIFEKSLYDKEIISKQEEKEYINSVNSIIKMDKNQKK